VIDLRRATAALLVAMNASAAVVATDAPPTTPAPAGMNIDLFPAAPQRDLVVRTCAACHAPEIVVAKRHTEDEWDEIIAKMVDRGAVATDAEQEQILQYLTKFFGPAPADAASAPHP
jgi:cytochrome c5